MRVRFLADECLLGPIVRQLRTLGHDVAEVPGILQGADDDTVLSHSVSEQRVLITEDYNFGRLAIRLRAPAVGILIIAVLAFPGTQDEVAVKAAEGLTRLGDTVKGKLTILENGRVRQRDLSLPD